MRAYVRVGVYTLSPLQACVPLHVSVFANVCNFLFLCESVCIGTGGKKQKVQLHSQYTNNESQSKLQLQQEPQRLISTLYSIFFL